MQSGNHLSKEVFDFVKSIGECRSKQEEDKIILSEMITLKSRLTEPNLPAKKVKELMLRTVYVEMLGYDAHFAHIHAINLSQNRNLMCKRMGYLTCCLCLPQDSQMLILLVATLQRDLSSQNYLEIAAALNTISKVATPSLVHALFDHVVRLLNHHNEAIRKKSVSVLFKFTCLVPSLARDSDPHFRQALCDKDPSVMAASLYYFLEMATNVQTRAFFKDLVPSCVLVLKQVVEHRMPKDYDYHRMPAPWTQICLLEILAALGADDKAASEQMYEIIRDVMRRADDIGSSVGYAVVYQCLLSISRIYPNPALTESAAQCISRLIESEDNNLKYTGITGLISIVKLSPQYATKHQMVVVDCLEDSDETLKRKTLLLLCRMANVHNVKVIVEKLIGILKGTSMDQHLKRELVVNVYNLAEKYAPDYQWYLRTINSLIDLASDQITPEILSSLIKLISDWRGDPPTISFVLDEYINILTRSAHIHDTFMQIAAWVLGEFGETLEEHRRGELAKLLCHAMGRRFDNDLTRGWIVTALLKISHGVLIDEVKDTISRYSSSRNEDIQQRCYEFAGFCLHTQNPFPLTNAIEEKPDTSLGFLQEFVSKELERGAKPYNPEKSRRNLAYLVPRAKQENSVPDPLQCLRMDAYKTPPAIVALPHGVSQAVPPGSSQLSVKKVLWTNQGYGGEIRTPAKPASTLQTPPPPPPAVSTPVSDLPRACPPQSQLSQKELERHQLAESIFGGTAGTQLDSSSGSAGLQGGLARIPSGQSQTNTVKKQPVTLLDF